MEITKTKQEIENAKREKLRREKPLVLEKILKIEERFKAGMATPVIDICYNRACNLKCQHCFTTRFANKDRSLTPPDLKKLSDEAHELGLCQFVISGGEPLILKDLKEVITAWTTTAWTTRTTSTGSTRSTGSIRSASTASTTTNGQHVESYPSRSGYERYGRRISPTTISQWWYGNGR